MTENIFEIAAEKKYRFAYKGSIGVEDLFTLTVGKLDLIYKNLKSQVKADEDSLLDTKSNEDVELETKIAIVTHIVAKKLAAAKKAEMSAISATTVAKIQAVIDRRADKDLEDASPEQLQAMMDDAKAKL